MTYTGPSRAWADQPAKKTNWGCLGLVLAPVLLFGSCAVAVATDDGDVEEHSYEAVEELPSSAREDELIGRAAYLTTMRNQPGASSVPDETLMEAGEAVCDGLDSGLDVDTITATTIDSGAGDLGVIIIGAAANSLCPEYSDEVAAFAASLG